MSRLDGTSSAMRTPPMDSRTDNPTGRTQQLRVPPTGPSPHDNDIRVLHGGKDASKDDVAHS